LWQPELKIVWPYVEKYTAKNVLKFRVISTIIKLGKRKNKNTNSEVFIINVTNVMPFFDCA